MQGITRLNFLLNCYLIILLYSNLEKSCVYICIIVQFVFFSILFQQMDDQNWGNYPNLKTHLLLLVLLSKSSNLNYPASNQFTPPLIVTRPVTTNTEMLYFWSILYQVLTCHIHFSTNFGTSTVRIHGFGGYQSHPMVPITSKINFHILARKN